MDDHSAQTHIFSMQGYFEVAIGHVFALIHENYLAFLFCTSEIHLDLWGESDVCLVFYTYAFACILELFPPSSKFVYFLVFKCLEN